MVCRLIALRAGVAAQLSLLAFAVVHGQTPLDAVNLVSEAQYRDVLDNRLYTRLGDNRGVGGPQHDLARDNILNAFKGFGLDASLDAFDWNGGTHHNVVAWKPGTTRANEVYVLGAHYDSVNNPGADDNASGTAGVIEAARVLSKCTLEASVCFVAFDREEQGLIGSDRWVAKNASPNIKGMISLDMIAYNAAAMANQAMIYGRSESSGLKTALASALNLYGNGIVASIQGGLDASDHAPFEWRGFQAALLIEAGVWSNPHYHKPTDSVDTPGYIDYAYATNMTRGAVGYVATAAGITAVPEPASLAIVGTGLAALAVRRRRTP